VLLWRPLYCVPGVIGRGEGGHFVSEAPLDIREKLAHMAQHDQARVGIDLNRTQHDRVRQELKLAPWAIVLSGMTMGAAFFAAGAAFFKLFGS
jgi:heme oxygenase